MSKPVLTLKDFMEAVKSMPYDGRVGQIDYAAIISPPVYLDLHIALWLYSYRKLIEPHWSWARRFFYPRLTASERTEAIVLGAAGRLDHI